jgi:hypothetical protein
MRVRFWTCQCSYANVSPRAAGTPVCKACGKLAPFTREAPRGQGGFDFGGEEKGSNEEKC